MMRSDNKRETGGDHGAEGRRDSMVNPEAAVRPDRMVKGFLDYLKVEKGLAPLTVSAYHSDLVQFAEFLKTRRRELAQARREDVRAFLSQLFANGVKDRSVARKLSTLRHFYKYLLLDRMIEQDPTLEIDSPKQWKVLPKSLAASEIDAILEGPARSSAFAETLPERSQTIAGFPRRWRNAIAQWWRCSMPAGCAFQRS